MIYISRHAENLSYDYTFDYCSGHAIQTTTESGWVILLKVCGTAARIITGFVSGNYVQVVNAIADSMSDGSNKSAVDVKGFITTIIDLAQQVKKRQKTANTHSFKELEAKKSNVVLGDFGCEGDRETDHLI